MSLFNVSWSRTINTGFQEYYLDRELFPFAEATLTRTCSTSVPSTTPFSTSHHLDCFNACPVAPMISSITLSASPFSCSFCLHSRCLSKESQGFGFGLTLRRREDARE